MNRILVSFVLSSVAASVTTVLAPAAWAQPSNPASLPDPGIRPGQGAKTDKTVRQPAPPALPGARAEPTAVTPAERSAADMPPTEALFDAINRGDLATARDSLNRGADLNGVNVLGLTPLELAVDLGRNEISFLLLSLRGGSGYSASRVPDGAPAPPPTRAERLATERAARVAARDSVVARPAAPPAPRAARLFAGDGGAPVPQAGFLGFDARR